MTYVEFFDKIAYENISAVAGRCGIRDRDSSLQKEARTC